MATSGLGRFHCRCWEGWRWREAWNVGERKVVEWWWWMLVDASVAPLSGRLRDAIALQSVGYSRGGWYWSCCSRCSRFWRGEGGFGVSYRVQTISTPSLYHLNIYARDVQSPVHHTGTVFDVGVVIAVPGGVRWNNRRMVPVQVVEYELYHVRSGVIKKNPHSRYRCPLYTSSCRCR